MQHINQKKNQINMKHLKKFQIDEKKVNNLNAINEEYGYSWELEPQMKELARRHDDIGLIAKYCLLIKKEGYSPSTYSER